MFYEWNWLVMIKYFTSYACKRYENESWWGSDAYQKMNNTSNSDSFPGDVIWLKITQSTKFTWSY